MIVRHHSSCHPIGEDGRRFSIQGCSRNGGCFGFTGVGASASPTLGWALRLHLGGRFGFTDGLGASTHPEAVGATRCHSCTCGKGRGAPALLPHSICPACALVEQIAWVKSRRYSTSGALFPTASGAFPSKASIIATIEAAAGLLHLPPLPPQRPASGEATRCVVEGPSASHAPASRSGGFRPQPGIRPV